MSVQTGVFYVVATPIGNLGDITQRAVEVLNSVDLIAAEDTRNSQKLLRHFSIQVPMMAFHEHNERDQCSEIIRRLEDGKSIALISDAGTPLISDPGYKIVTLVHQHGLKVVPIPGACALITALSVAGMPTDHFCFEGFLPAKVGAREKILKELKDETRTLVFYEAPHRILACVESIAAIFGDQRKLTLLRELTKIYETIKNTTAIELGHWIRENPEQQKGECVLVVEGAERIDDPEQAEIRIDVLLQSLLEKMSVKDAAQVCAELTGKKKNSLYEQALLLREKAKQHKD